MLIFIIISTIINNVLWPARTLHKIDCCREILSALDVPRVTRFPNKWRSIRCKMFIYLLNNKHTTGFAMLCLTGGGDNVRDCKDWLFGNIVLNNHIVSHLDDSMLARIWRWHRHHCPIHVALLHVWSESIRTIMLWMFPELMLLQ
jgi:hypothetical protein